MLLPIHHAALARVQAEYTKSTTPWFVGYSGGKDSSAVLKIVFLAIMELKHRPRPVHVVFCDTGVEIPPVRDYVYSTLKALSKEARKHSIPILPRIVTPSISNRFFVKVIGRGYPPPTNKFRWCTDKLRIKPVDAELSRQGSQHSTVLLGLRNGESPERDRTLARHRTKRSHFLKQSNTTRRLIFSPILDFSVSDVWHLLRTNRAPASIDSGRIELLYQFASGECPMLRDPKGSPCGKGRFGCWTCTVVRKDQAVTNLVKSGYSELAPLLEFRNWLASVRDDHHYRNRFRRNGTRGLGPFTLSARKEIFSRLRLAQKASGLSLISHDETSMIYALWRQDRLANDYKE